MSEDKKCPECNTYIGSSAFRDADGNRVCARCISGEDRDAAILRAFPNGIPENLEQSMSEWKKAKALAVKFTKARIPLTEAEKKRLEYLKKKHQEGK